MHTPSHSEVRHLMHALREAVGALAIRVTLLDDEDLSAGARATRDAMLGDVERMARRCAR